MSDVARPVIDKNLAHQKKSKMGHITAKSNQFVIEMVICWKIFLSYSQMPFETSFLQFVPVPVYEGPKIDVPNAT